MDDINKLTRRILHHEKQTSSESSDESPLKPVSRKNDDDDCSDSNVDVTDEEIEDNIKSQGLYPKLGKSDFYISKDELCASNNTSRTSIKQVKRKFTINFSLGGLWINFSLGGCFLLALYFIYSYLCLSSEKKSFEKISAAELTEELKHGFVKQKMLSWKIINSTLKNVLNDDDKPRSPARIMLLGVDNKEKTAECLGYKIGKLISKRWKNSTYLTIDGRTYMNKNTNKIQMEIDDAIKNNSDHNSLKVYFIVNLDLIPAKAAIIFHSYCDDDHAHFKKAVFIMTFSSYKYDTGNDLNSNAVSADLTVKDMKKFDAAARKKLEIAWQDLDQDKLYPLLSRITVSVAPIMPELEETLANLC